MALAASTTCGSRQATAWKPCEAIAAVSIDSERSGSPTFLAVICGTGYGYRRADGVFVVPVGVLGP